MKRIALATCSSLRELTPSDRKLVEPLRRRGIEAIAAPWDEEADWKGYDAVILRSCWNYHLKHEQFRSWLDQLEDKKIPVWNSTPVISWNMDKIYLQDLAEQGVSIIPTHWVCHENSVRDLKETLLTNGWTNALIKPRIGASADFVWTTSLDTAKEDQARFDEALKERNILVQPFINEIEKGEWSFVFIDGQYCHAALKRPEFGKYLVQTNHGGTSEIKHPASKLIDQAEQVVRRAASVTQTERPFLYARVDAVEIEGTLLLMELELIEPELFLGDVPKTAEHFAAAIAYRIEGSENA